MLYGILILIIIVLCARIIQINKQAKTISHSMDIGGFLIYRLLLDTFPIDEEKKHSILQKAQKGFNINAGSLIVANGLEEATRDIINKDIQDHLLNEAIEYMDTHSPFEAQEEKQEENTSLQNNQKVTQYKKKKKK